MSAPRPALNDEQLASRRRAWPSSISNGRWCMAAAERWLELNQTNEEARRFAAFAALHLYKIDTRRRAPGHAARHRVHQSAGRLPGAAAADLADEGTPAARRRCCRQLVVKYPDLTEAHYALAQAALQSDNFALAIEHAQKARELGPYWSPAGLLLARVQMLTGDQRWRAGHGASKVVDQDHAGLVPARICADADAGRQGRRGSQGAGRAREQRNAPARSRSARWPTSISSSAIATPPRSASATWSRAAASSTSRCSISARSPKSREAWDDALQIYGRVTGGEFAMAAQTRAARIKAKQQRLEAGLKHLEDFAATRPQYRIDAITRARHLLSDQRRRCRRARAAGHAR